MGDLVNMPTAQQQFPGNNNFTQNPGLAGYNWSQQAGVDQTNAQTGMQMNLANLQQQQMQNQALQADLPNKMAQSQLGLATANAQIPNVGATALATLANLESTAKEKNALADEALQRSAHSKLTDAQQQLETITGQLVNQYGSSKKPGSLPTLDTEQELANARLDYAKRGMGDKLLSTIPKEVLDRFPGMEDDIREGNMKALAAFHVQSMNTKLQAAMLNNQGSLNRLGIQVESREGIAAAEREARARIAAGRLEVSLRGLESKKNTPGYQFGQSLRNIKDGLVASGRMNDEQADQWAMRQAAAYQSGDARVRAQAEVSVNNMNAMMQGKPQLPQPQTEVGAVPQVQGAKTIDVPGVGKVTVHP